MNKLVCGLLTLLFLLPTQLQAGAKCDTYQLGDLCGNHRFCATLEYTRRSNGEIRYFTVPIIDGFMPVVYFGEDGGMIYDYREKLPYYSPPKKVEPSEKLEFKEMPKLLPPAPKPYVKSSPPPELERVIDSLDKLEKQLKAFNPDQQKKQPHNILEPEPDYLIVPDYNKHMLAPLLERSGFA